MASSVYFGFVFTLSMVLLTINCAPSNSDAVDLQTNTNNAGNSHKKASHHKREYPTEGILLGKREYPTEGILLGKREYPTEGILLGKREYPTEGILLGKREYPTEGILLGRREYPTEGILLGKRNFRFFAPKGAGATKTY